ncbi:hypothetical protein L207DRAFT_517190 [Hyaloscypha variabilis F]|uniref:Uncharacterized protein n=1 Tax=Hyaloscypha variabilis (strain UAMH 11265 / GT02V1 / F) TaxID=1149755 RepID=A0A2J6R9A9_HYAVF|nr:hypothetical protein L207DRAFT_517190 [Hyaloscypha variabilis F]
MSRLNPRKVSHRLLSFTPILFIHFARFLQWLTKRKVQLWSITTDSHCLSKAILQPQVRTRHVVLPKAIQDPSFLRAAAAITSLMNTPIK